MTLYEYRSDKARCMAMRRMLDMDFMKKFIEAVFTDLELQESLALEKHLGTDNPNVELRLQNRRKGMSDFHQAMKMCCEPVQIQGKMPAATYEPENFDGESGDMLGMTGGSPGWEPVGAS